MYHFIFGGSSFLLRIIASTVLSFLSDFPWNRINFTSAAGPQATFRRVIMGDMEVDQCNPNKYGCSSINKI